MADVTLTVQEPNLTTRRPRIEFDGDKITVTYVASGQAYSCTLNLTNVPSTAARSKDAISSAARTALATFTAELLNYCKPRMVGGDGTVIGF